VGSAPCGTASECILSPLSCYDNHDSVVFLLTEMSAHVLKNTHTFWSNSFLYFQDKREGPRSSLAPSTTFIIGGQTLRS
jgi:hypothetical protein